MDTVSAYSRKAEVLQSEALSPIVKNLQKTIHSRLISGNERLLGPALVRSAAFELLRCAARAQRRKLAHVAADIIQSSEALHSQ